MPNTPRIPISKAFETRPTSPPKSRGTARCEAV